MPLESRQRARTPPSLLPTPCAGTNRNSRGAVRLTGSHKGKHGIALGLEQVIELMGGVLPKEFRSWDEVPDFYIRLINEP